jgi:hypothetical protein
MASSVELYIRGIPADVRPLFDRVRHLILEACPEATVALAYGMPTFSVGRRRLHVAVWQHGISIYGWKQYGEGGITVRHPELLSGTGTIQIGPKEAAGIDDEEFMTLARSVLLGD